MKRAKGIKTVTFEAEYGFMVDIVDTVDERNGCALWDIFLYRKNMAVKMGMFGLLKENTPTLTDVKNIVEANLPEYYPDYDEQYCQYDEVDQGYLDDYDYDEDGEDICCPVCGSHDIEVVQDGQEHNSNESATTLEGEEVEVVIGNVRIKGTVVLVENGVMHINYD